MKFLKTKAPIWTVFFHRRADSGGIGYCWHVEIGHKKGQPISGETVVNLAKGYWKRNGKRMKLEPHLYYISKGSYYDRYDERCVSIDCSQP